MRRLINISVKELHVAAQMALEAIGVPSGLEQDGAMAIVWHETRGLKGLSTLIHDMDALNAIPIYQGKIIDFRGLSGLVAAPMAIDLAIAIGQELKVKNIRSPFAVAAYAARRGIKYRWFKLSWCRGTALIYEGKASFFYHKSKTSNILNITTAKGLPPELPSISISANELEARNLESIRTGLTISESAYNTVLKIGSQVLVPTSKISRSSAGAEVDDNE